jgi:hypothetical protein
MLEVYHKIRGNLAKSGRHAGRPCLLGHPERFLLTDVQLFQDKESSEVGMDKSWFRVYNRVSLPFPGGIYRGIGEQRLAVVVLSALLYT